MLRQHVRAQLRPRVGLLVRLPDANADAFAWAASFCSASAPPFHVTRVEAWAHAGPWPRRPSINS